MNIQSQERHLTIPRVTYNRVSVSKNRWTIFRHITSIMAATSLEGSYDGLAPFTYPAIAKPLQTYYRVFGDLKSNITPLVCLHGGPGYPHNYLLNHSILTNTKSIPVIFYDQIGSGLSTRLTETASTPEIWTEEIFFEQLRQLLSHLGIQKHYDILGHSWGGMLGSAFASTRPDGLRRLILANSAASKHHSIANRVKYRKQVREIFFFLRPFLGVELFAGGSRNFRRSSSLFRKFLMKPHSNLSNSCHKICRMCWTELKLLISGTARRSAL